MPEDPPVTKPVATPKIEDLTDQLAILGGGTSGSHVGAYAPASVKAVFDEVRNSMAGGSHVGAYAVISAVEIRPITPPQETTPLKSISSDRSESSDKSK